jgi:hypothetical protein
MYEWNRKYAFLSHGIQILKYKITGVDDITQYPSEAEPNNQKAN